MTITPISTAQEKSAATATVMPQKKTLDSNDFMKLLAVQFQSQDPMKPMEDSAFIAQMAQFTSLEQTNTLTAEMVRLRTDQQLSTANSYLGRQVTVNDGGGRTATGTVSAVEITEAGPRIVIGGFSYPSSSVLLVEPGNVSVPPPPSGGTGGA